MTDHITIPRALLEQALANMVRAELLYGQPNQAIQEAIRAELAKPVEAITTDMAVKRLCQALRDDLDYAWSWHCNVAMSAYDAGCPRDVANEGAARFMQLLAGVDTRKHFAFEGTQTKSEPVESSYTAMQLAAMVLSDCGISTVCTTLHERVARRIALHEEQLIDGLQKLAKPPTPAWHDAPTCAGLWLCNYGILEVVCINQPDVDNFDDFYNAGGRWYGPIPQEGEKS